MTADCLPILLCNEQGNEIAAIHAGWRGLLHGIIPNTLMQMNTPRQHTMAWIGPAICQHCYETGEEVYQAFRQHYGFADQFFLSKQSKWHADLPGLAKKILQQEGIENVFFSNKCTFSEKNNFYSYRRSPQTGRMVSLIWFC